MPDCRPRRSLASAETELFPLCVLGVRAVGGFLRVLRRGQCRHAQAC